MRPGAARTVITVAALVALGGAGALVACGSFGSAPADVTTEPDASATDAASDAADAALSCVVIFDDDFTTADKLKPGSQDAGPAVVSNDPDHAVEPPSLAASAVISRGKYNFVNSSAGRDMMLPATFAPGERVELEYDLFLDQPIDAYAEVGCTLELKNAQSERTRLLFTLQPTGKIEAKVDPANPSAMSLSKVLVMERTPGRYHVTSTVGATSAKMGLVHYDIRDGGSADFALPIQGAIDRLRLVCGIDYANTDAAAPVTLQVWVDDVVIRRCVPPTP